jgi:hypothetical protein
MKRRIALLVTALACSWIPPDAAGQETILAQETLPDEVADRVIAYFNDPGTLRFSGESRIPAGRVITGDVAVLGGPLTLAGTIDGMLMVVNGDLILEGDGRIDGSVLLVGGEIRGDAEAAITGEVAVYAEYLRYRRRGGEITYVGTGPEEEPGISSDLGVGSLRFTVRAGDNYNRVEGLPVQFGPIFESSGRNPLRIDALAVWRTDSGLTLDPDLLGYRVRMDQMVGGRRTLSVGGTLFSEVYPIEAWGITDLEASLATFLLHTDYRDYVRRRGWEVHARFMPRSLPFTARIDYRDERHEFAQVGSPWSLTRNDETWRPQPLVLEGETRSLGWEVRYDSRNDRRNPSSGLFVSARGRLGLDADWRLPPHSSPYVDPLLGAPTDEVQEEIPAQSRPEDFATAFVDLRSYNRVTRSSTLNFRALAGGSLDGDPLPPQYQHALGGEGSVPGYPLFFADCQAREVRVGRPGGEGADPYPAFPNYGCDQLALFQIELRTSFYFTVDLAEIGLWDWLPVLDLSPGWSVFADWGRGWVVEESESGLYPRSDSPDLFDVGFGGFLGDIGIYWAFPITGDHSGSNFFIRLRHRF